MKDDIQKLVNQYVDSESGAELVVNATTKLGAIAGMVVDPHTNMVAYQMLASLDVMAYDRIRVFELKDHLLQKDKDRLVLRSTGGNIYVIQPCRSDEAISTFATHPLSDENKDIVRMTLMSSFHN